MGGRLDTPHLYEAQVMVVAAAGNERTNKCTSLYDPVTTPDKLLVGSTTNRDDASSFSNYGACVHVQVPPPNRTAPAPTPAHHT